MFQIKLSTDRRKYLSSIGLNPDDVSSWGEKWRTLKHNAKDAGKKVLLTFEDYVNLAVLAGLTSPNQIGQSSNSYHMSRNGDIGDYVIGNCRFIPQLENQKERFTNGGAEIGYAKSRSKTMANCEGRVTQAFKRAKDYVLFDPNGNVHNVHNLKRFCSENGLNQGCMWKAVNNPGTKHKDWTGKYAD